MKEMLGNLADGQIEFYRSVSDILFFFAASLLIFVLGHGGVGQDHSNYSAYTRGRLAHVVHIPMIISNRVFLTPVMLCDPALYNYQDFSEVSCAGTCSSFDVDSRLANIRSLSADS